MPPAPSIALYSPSSSPITTSAAFRVAPSSPTTRPTNSPTFASSSVTSVAMASPPSVDSEATLWPCGARSPQGPHLVVQLSRQLLARVDPELSVHVPEVVLDGLRAQEELGRRLARGVPIGEEHADLQLLRGELVEARRVAPACALAGGQELGARALAPWPGAELVERLESRPELLPRRNSPARAAAALAEAELRAGFLEAVTGCLVEAQRLLEVALERVTVREQPA